MKSKRSLLIFINIFYPLFSFSNISDSTKKEKAIIGLNGSFIVTTWDEPTITPSVYFSKGKNFVSFGPMIPLWYGTRTYFYGFECTYRHTPQIRHKTINMFFFHTTQYNVLHREESWSYEDYYTSEMISGKSTDHSKTALFSIGYGFDVKFLKRFHISQYTGAGILINNYHRKYENNQYPERNNIYQNTFAEWHVLLALTLGIDIFN